MDYFIMRQDERVPGVKILTTSSLNPYRQLTHEQINDIALTKILQVKEGSPPEYPDCLEASNMLVSEKLKRIMSKYQRNVIYKTIVLIEKKANRQEIYYLMSAPPIECAAAETVYDRQAQVREFVLDEEKVGHARIFSAGNYGNRIFVRLDVAESILRRDPYGVWFEKVTVANKESV